jgi:hypothetical protein
MGEILSDLLPQYMHTEILGRFEDPPSSQLKKRKRNAASTKVLTTDDTRSSTPRLVRP